MAGPNDRAAALLPNLPPEVRDSWLKQYGPPGAAPSVPGPVRVPGVPAFAQPISIPTTVPPATAPSPPPTSAPDPMAATLAAANARPGGAPAAPSSPSLFDMKLGQPAPDPAAARQPRNGDWEGHNKLIDKREAEKNLANLEGATFYNAPGGVAGASMTGAPVMVSPGGWRPASRTEQVQEGVKFSPDTEKAAEKADESQRDAARWGMLAGTAEAEREMAYLQRHAQLQETHALDQKRRADAQRAQYEGELGKLQALTEATRADKIPTEAWFIRRNDEGKVNPAATFASALGYMLGGISQGLLKLGENPVNQVIRDQIQTQKDNAALNRQKLEDQRSLLGQMTRTFGDERVAEEAAWLAYLEKAKTDMGRIASESKSDAVQAKYRSALALLDKDWAMHKQQWDALTQDKVVRSNHDVFAPPSYAGGPQKMAPPDPLFVPTGPNGQGFQASTEKEAIAARGVITAEQDVVPLLERLVELRSQSNFGERLAASKGVYESERMARIKSLQAQVALGLRELSATSPGAMDKGMQELAGQIQGDWMSTQGNPEAAAKEFINTIRRKKDSLQRGQAGQDVSRGLTRDAKGNIVTHSTGNASFASPKAPTPDSFKRAE